MARSKGTSEVTYSVKEITMRNLVALIDAIYKKTRDGSDAEGLEHYVDKLRNMLRKPADFGMTFHKLKAMRDRIKDEATVGTQVVREEVNPATTL